METVPALQLVGVTLPVVQYAPAGQLVHSLGSDRSVALEKVAGAAPTLTDHRIVPLRSLRLRGRVRGADIFVGLPCDVVDAQ